MDAWRYITSLTCLVVDAEFAHTPGDGRSRHLSTTPKPPSPAAFRTSDLSGGRHASSRLELLDVEVEFSIVDLKLLFAA